MLVGAGSFEIGNKGRDEYVDAPVSGFYNSQKGMWNVNTEREKETRVDYLL